MGHIAINLENGNKPAISVGSHVRVKGTDRYFGKVVKEEYVRLLVVEDVDGIQVAVHPYALEVAPRLTPEQAWDELPYTVLAEVNKRMARGASGLSEYDQRIIRHQCYKLLGGAGITVDETVKARVRKTITKIANAMGVDLD